MSGSRVKFLYSFLELLSYLAADLPDCFRKTEDRQRENDQNQLSQPNLLDAYRKKSDNHCCKEDDEEQCPAPQYHAHHLLPIILFLK